MLASVRLSFYAILHNLGPPLSAWPSLCSNMSIYSSICPFLSTVPSPLPPFFPLPGAELILCAVILYEYCRRRTSTRFVYGWPRSPLCYYILLCAMTVLYFVALFLSKTSYAVLYTGSSQSELRIQVLRQGSSLSKVITILVLMKPIATTHLRLVSKFIATYDRLFNVRCGFSLP